MPNEIEDWYKSVEQARENLTDLLGTKEQKHKRAETVEVDNCIHKHWDEVKLLLKEKYPEEFI